MQSISLGDFSGNDLTRLPKTIFRLYLTIRERKRQTTLETPYTIWNDSNENKNDVDLSKKKVSLFI